MKECWGNIKDRGKAINAYISVEDKDYLQQQASEAQTRWFKGMFGQLCFVHAVLF